MLLVNAGVVKKELFGWGCNVVMDGSEYHEKPGLLGLGDEIKHSEAVNLSSRVGGRPLAAAAGPYMSAVITSALREQLRAYFELALGDVDTLMAKRACSLKLHRVRRVVGRT